MNDERPPAPELIAEATEPAVGPGILLREARAAAGLSQEDVASALRQDIKLVVALEQNDFNFFSAPIFVSGYLRAYARLVNIPPETVLAAYHAVGNDTLPALSPSARTPDPGGNSRLARGVAFGLLAVVIAAGLVAWWQARDTRASVVTHAGVERAPAGVSAPVPPIVAEVPVPTVSAPVPQATPPDQITLTLRFSTDSWAEVTDVSGRPVFQSLGKAGTEQAVSGAPPLTVLLGYSPGVTVEYNGAPFDTSPYVRQHVARFTIGAAAAR